MAVISAFKRAFSILSAERAKAFQWFGREGQWRTEQPSVSDIVINQRIQGGEVSFVSQPTEEEDMPLTYSEYKAYIVWYSGANYRIKREVAILFWLSNREAQDENRIRDWLDKACKSAMSGANLKDVENWKNAYLVLSAQTGNIRSELSPFVHEFVTWTYTKDNGLVKSPGRFTK